MSRINLPTHLAFRYAYDAAGRRVSKNDERYGYNGRGELILATNVVTGAEFAYRYDDIGNRVWSREFGTNCVYAANELNQYTNVVRGGVFERPAFDLDGSQTNVVTSTGEWAVEYNGENRPVRWTRPADGAVVAMSYDRMGRPDTCRGGGSAQWPTGDPSHGSGPVPQNIRRCLNQTRWALRKVEAFVPDGKGCCENRYFWTAEPSLSGASYGIPFQQTLGLCFGGLLVIILLAPLGM